MKYNTFRKGIRLHDPHGERINSKAIGGEPLGQQDKMAGIPDNPDNIKEALNAQDPNDPNILDKGIQNRVKRYGN